MKRLKDSKWYNELVKKRGESRRIKLPLSKRNKTKGGFKKEKRR